MTQEPSIARTARDLPPMSPRQEFVVRSLAVVALVYGLYWLWWRWTQTLNPDALVFSLILVSAETWGWIGSTFFLFHTWKISDRQPQPPPKGRSVDVFITTYDEPLEVLRRTAIGARAICYPHRTYILDDGKRDEVLQLAQAIGVGYIRREGNENAKAGNLNFALSVTSGEFILQLDTDHVPLPTIIERLLGYFDDPAVGFIQTPQDFYNTDSFTHVFNEEARSLWEENRIFYSLLQPGKDVHNASFFCGSCGMLRRAALEDIGGFSTETIIEDMETSLKLHTRGWKSVYHAEPLAFGLSPGSAASFHVQRLRWAQGSMQMLRKFNPLTLPGLTPGQRAAYFAANVYPVDGLQKAIFYFTPVVFLLTGMVPLVADTDALLWRLIPYLVITIGAFELLARGTGWLFIQERYNMAKFFTYILSLQAFFAKRKLKFNVTPKGTTDVPVRTYLPQLVLLIVSVCALVFAPLAFSFGWIDYQVESMRLAFWMSAVWVIWNVYYAASVVRLCLQARQQRSDHRFRDQFPVSVRLLDDDPVRARAHSAVSRDLNPQGMAFRGTTRLAPGDMVEVTLPLATRGVHTRGTIVHVWESDTVYGVVYTHGVKFEAMSIDDRDTIELHCTQHSVPSWRKKYRQSIDLWSRATEVVRNARVSFRRVVQLPAIVTVTHENGRMEETPALLEEMSSGGAGLLMDSPLPDGTRVSLSVPGTMLHGVGEVVSCRVLESPMSVRFAIGVRLERAVLRLDPESSVSVTASNAEAHSEVA
ncbi:MAG TPA: glycosyltransferase [Longimicrobiales bacterium]